MPYVRPLTALTVVTLLLLGCRGSSKEEGSPNRRPSQKTGSRAGAPTTVEPPAYGAIGDALRGPGNLAVCGQRPEPGDASGSYERRIFTLAAGTCSPATTSPAAGAVVVNAYDSALIQETTAGLDFGDRLAAWTYQQFVISVTDSSPPEVVSGVEAAMAALGAEKTYDERPSRAGGG